MPSYRYVGKVPFFNSLYGIYVEPNDVIETPYLLPKEWDTFVLEDLFNPPPLLPHSQVVTVDVTKEIITKGYTTIVIILRNYEEASLFVRCRVLSAPPIVLDKFTPYLRMESGIYDLTSTIYLEPLSNIPEVTIYYGFTETFYGMFSMQTVNSGVIGTPSDGSYSDGLLQLSSDMTVSDAIDSINELLASGAIRVNEETIYVTEEIKNQGFFYTEYPVNMNLAEETDLIPIGGVEQEYLVDYTIVYDSDVGKSKVIFDSTVEGGPSRGIQDYISVGDKLTFKYYY